MREAGSLLAQSLTSLSYSWCLDSQPCEKGGRGVLSNLWAPDRPRSLGVGGAEGGATWDSTAIEHSVYETHAPYSSFPLASLQLQPRVALVSRSPARLCCLHPGAQHTETQPRVPINYCTFNSGGRLQSYLLMSLTGVFQGRVTHIRSAGPPWDFSKRCAPPLPLQLLYCR